MHCISAPVPKHTETAICPLSYRRIVLVLGYLLYLVTARPTLAFAALRESWALATGPNPSTSWWSDLQFAAAALPVPLVINLAAWPEADTVQTLIAAVPALVAQHLWTITMTSLRLPLLQARLHFDSALDRAPVIKTVCTLRDYLQLPTHRQRSAIALLMLSEHPLAVERLRRAPIRRDRALRVCRWCQHPWAVETETHALLECDSEPLSTLREAFLANLFAVLPSLRSPHFHLASSAFLDMLLRGSTTLPLLANYVADTFALCDVTPLLILGEAPDGAREEPGVPGTN